RYVGASPGIPSEGEVWSHAQALTAVFADPDAPDADLRTFTPSLGVAFSAGQVREHDGIAYGWIANPERPDITVAQPALWTVSALALALGRQGLLLTAAQRHDAEEWLTIAEHVLENYRPASAIGGWSMFPLQNDPDQADAYTGTLAASALLAVRE